MADAGGGTESMVNSGGLGGMVEAAWRMMQFTYIVLVVRFEAF